MFDLEESTMLNANQSKVMVEWNENIITDKELIESIQNKAFDLIEHVRTYFFEGNIQIWKTYHQ